MNTMNCRKCNGTGFRKEVAHVDGGRCWSCGPVNTITYLTDEEFAAEQAVKTAERQARREARRAATA